MGGPSIVEARPSVATDNAWLGSAVRLLREQRKLSARDLSLQSGLSESYVGKLETGRVQPSLRCFGQLALALELNTAEIFFLVTHEGRRGLAEGGV
jgi:transcriptional regulator with XRE-family HTH domain